MSFAYMKLLESRPRRYDRGMSLLTLGALSRLKRQIATHVRSGAQVLDLGCGTGTLAAMCLAQGGHVTGIDADRGMLDVARARSPSAEYLHIDVGNLDEHLQGRSFDLIASTLVFSELTRAERLRLLQQARGLLKTDGTLFIGDEVVPKRFAARCLYYALRVPMQILAWLISQTTTTSIEDMEDDLRELDLHIVNRRSYLLGSLVLLEIR